MGSLLPGWDRKRHRAPKAMRECEEPSKINPNTPVSPRSVAAKPPTAKLTGPPALGRASCPPVLHGVVEKDGKAVPVKITVTSPPRLARASAGPAISPTSPRSPFATGSAPTAATMFSRLLEKNEGECDEDRCPPWCDRMDSSALNVRPDDPADVEAWRHGKFMPDDPMHSMHILDVECGSPKDGAAASEGIPLP